MARMGNTAPKPKTNNKLKACAALLRYIDSRDAALASRALYESTLESVYNGIKTPDLGGQASTSEFVDEVIREARGKLEVWDALGD